MGVLTLSLGGLLVNNTVLEARYDPQVLLLCLNPFRRTAVPLLGTNQLNSEYFVPQTGLQSSKGYNPLRTSEEEVVEKNTLDEDYGDGPWESWGGR